MNDPSQEQLPARFVEFAKSVLDQREARGIGGINAERNRFANHIETAPFASKVLQAISQQDIQDWVSAMSCKQASDSRGVRTLSRSTIDRSLSLCSMIFTAAEDAGVIERNPFHGLRLSDELRGRETPERWLYLDKAEQDAIAECSEIADAERFAIMFAIGTGLKQGHQFGLKLDDVHVDRVPPVVIARSKERAREVPLLGPSLEATIRWMKMWREYAPDNPDRLLFPTPGGRQRGVGKPLGRGDAFPRALRKAGILRTVRWEDLRHTCAASMAKGFWGKRYSLTDIQRMFGLSSVAVAQRYAHLVEDGLAPAANGDDDDLAGGRHDGAAEGAYEHRLGGPRTIRADVLHVGFADFGAGHQRLEERGQGAGSRIAAVPNQTAIREPLAWRAPRVDLDHESVGPFSTALFLPSETLARASAALSAGKHLLLVGPPGTGKTELAHALVQAAVARGYCHGAHVATASADWTTFDTIGGYAVERNGRLRFRSGALLKAIENHQWLVIDELNRADVDRAFGEMMTVLGGKTTDTAYQLDDGTTVRIGPDPTATHSMRASFRVLATMNTWDKTSLFRLSYAVQRRFAIVHVGVPQDEAYAALIRHVSHEDVIDAVLDAAAEQRLIDLFSTRGLLGAREVGPAIAIDLVRYTRRRSSGRRASPGDSIAEGIAMFVLAQLEGLPAQHASDAYRAIMTCVTGSASDGGIRELRARFAELFPHLRLGIDDAER